MDIDKAKGVFELNRIEQVLAASLDQNAYSFEESDLLFKKVMDSLSRSRGSDLSSFVPGSQLHTARSQQNRAVLVLEAMANQLLPHVSPQMELEIAAFLEPPAPI